MSTSSLPTPVRQLERLGLPFLSPMPALPASPGAVLLMVRSPTPTGIADGMGLVATGPVAAYETHFATNVVGPLRLFQNLLPLLQASSKPQFLGVSSAVGSNTLKVPMPTAHGGVSKAALNFLVTKIASEHGDKDGLTAWVTHPGLVETDMGNTGIEMLKAIGVEVPSITVDESVAGLSKLVDNATKETMGGKFIQYDGSPLPW